jgi:signal transduction histidine kinase
MSAGPLERRLITAMVLFGVALAGTYGLVLPQIAFKTEDEVFQKQMAQALDARLRDPATPLPPAMREVRAGDATPTWLRERLATAKAGVHEWNDVPLDPDDPDTDLFVGIGTDAKGRVELVYDVRPFEAFDEAVPSPGFDAVIVAGLAMAIGGSLAGWWALRAVFVALRRLPPLIGPATAGTPPAVNSFADDEVGALADRLVGARREVDAALARERRFTREASHELRTPVAIIAGAVELLRRDGLAAASSLFVDRIAAANRRMEELISAFLWLSRKDAHAEELQWLDAEALVTKVAGELRAAHATVADAFAITVTAPVRFEGVPLCAEIVLRNLLDNALRHRGTSPVRIAIGDAAVSVENDIGGGATGSRPSHGLGLGIVLELCTRFGWRCETARDGSRFTACLRFATDLSTRI